MQVTHEKQGTAFSFFSFILNTHYIRKPEIEGSNPTGGMDVCCECCVLLGRGLCDGMITRPEECYQMWRVVVCDQENS